MFFVVVSGIPAAGKSTVAAGLAAESLLPLFDKDRFLETLFDGRRPKNPVERRALSEQADRALERAVRQSARAIAVSWWRHSASAADSGTRTEWLRDLPGTVVEVYCECPPATAFERFVDRKRHPGHMDERWSQAELLAQLTAAAELGPLNAGMVLKVDSSAPVDFGNLWQRVQNIARGP